MNYVKAKDLVTFKTGKLDSNAAEEGGLYPFFTCAQTTYQINSFAFDTECVLLAGNNAGAIFPLKYFNGKFNAYQRTYIIETKQKNQLNIRYFYFFLVPYLKAFEQQATGATTKFLTMKILNNIQVALPEIEVQDKIAEILSAYDDLIETNNQRIATLEQLAQQIYKEWFVRMRFPDWEHTPVYHGIPEGWKIENFDKFCMLQRGFDLPDQDIKEGQYPVMASTTIKAYHNKYKVEPPVITTGRSGSLGTVLFSHQKAWPLNTALFVKNFYGNSPYLVFYTLKSLKLENFNAGAGVPSLNRNHLRAIKIKVPPKDIQNQFDKIISDLFNQKIVLEESNSILEKTRNLLLPRLISGKLTLKQAEASIN